MRIEDLQNYGANMHSLGNSMHKVATKKVQRTMFYSILQEIELFKSLKLGSLIRKNKEQYSKINFDRIWTFFTNEEFIQSKISDVATFAAI